MQYVPLVTHDTCFLHLALVDLLCLRLVPDVLTLARHHLSDVVASHGLSRRHRIVDTANSATARLRLPLYFTTNTVVRYGEVETVLIAQRVLRDRVLVVRCPARRILLNILRVRLLCGGRNGRLRRSATLQRLRLTIVAASDEVDVLLLVDARYDVTSDLIVDAADPASLLATGLILRLRLITREHASLMRQFCRVSVALVELLVRPKSGLVGRIVQVGRQVMKLLLVHCRVGRSAPVCPRLEIVRLEALYNTVLLVRRHLAAISHMLDSLWSRNGTVLLSN